MATGLARFADITISTTGAPVQAPGFGTPLILGCDQGSDIGGGALTARYASLSEMVADGFATTSPEYLCAQQIFAQDESPEEIVVGKRSNKPTMRWAVTPVAQNAGVYALTISDGGTEHDVSITADSSATAAEIIGALKTAIDALSLDVTTSDQTTYLRIVADVAGDWFQVAPANMALLKVVQDHADPGITADLDAIKAEDGDWYAILCLTGSDAEVLAIAAWAESDDADRLYLADTQDGRIPLTGTTDIASQVVALARDKTAVFYHPDNRAFFAAAVAGAMLPKDPGSESWHAKEISGVAAPNLTSAQQTFCTNKLATFYAGVTATKSVTVGGKVSSGEWIDVIRFLDWIEAELQAAVFTAISSGDKLPFSDRGIAVITNAIMGVLRRGVEAGGLIDNDNLTVTAPRASDFTAGERALRNLTGVEFTGDLAGAIHLATIRGALA